MIVPRNLKHNALKQVDIPRPRELYAQYGLTKKLDAGKYSGDEAVNPNLDKISGAQVAMKADDELQKAAADKEE